MKTVSVRRGLTATVEKLIPHYDTHVVELTGITNFNGYSTSGPTSIRVDFCNILSIETRDGQSIWAARTNLWYCSTEIVEKTMKKVFEKESLNAV